MTVRISREVTVPATPERVWEFVADPDNRAAAISVVRDWEGMPDGGTVWHVKLPIPVINRTIRVETHDRERTRPEKVSFVGRSKVFRVRGEHELLPTEGGTTLVSRFMVDGKVPGVETFFERRLDGELDNLERALRESLATDESVDESADGSEGEVADGSEREAVDESEGEVVDGSEGEADVERGNEAMASGDEPARDRASGSETSEGAVEES